MDFHFVLVPFQKLNNVLCFQADQNQTVGTPIGMGIPDMTVQYAGQLFKFNHGVIQLGSNPSLVLEQQADNTVLLKPFTGIPQQYWKRARPDRNSDDCIDLPRCPLTINQTPEFIGCNVEDEHKG